MWSRKLVDIVIIDPISTRENFLTKISSTNDFATSYITPTKKKKTKLSKLSLKISILPLSKKIFNYLHKQVDVFLQVCVNNV